MLENKKFTELSGEEICNVEGGLLGLTTGAIVVIVVGVVSAGAGLAAGYYINK